MKKIVVPMTGTISFALCMLLTSAPANAQAAQASSPEAASPQAPPTLLDMPLVGVDEGQRFQQVRSVARSSVSMKQLLPVSSSPVPGPSLANVSGEAFNQTEAQPILGHPLPTSAKTSLGFPRANFATGKSAAGTRASSTGQPSTPALSNTVIK
jgi:hypothetical protein